MHVPERSIVGPSNSQEGTQPQRAIMDGIEMLHRSGRSR